MCHRNSSFDLLYHLGNARHRLADFYWGWPIFGRVYGPGVNNVKLLSHFLRRWEYPSTESFPLRKNKQKQRKVFLTESRSFLPVRRPPTGFENVPKDVPEFRKINRKLTWFIRSGCLQAIHLEKYWKCMNLNLPRSGIVFTLLIVQTNFESWVSGFAFNFFLIFKWKLYFVGAIFLVLWDLKF